jgi:putative hydrolases of HD superfamily
VRRGVPAPESIADHMYRMAVMALVAGMATNGSGGGVGGESGQAGCDGSAARTSATPPLDVSKCVLLALAHDVAEAIVGDIAPGDGVSKADKAAREAAAMERIRGMLGGGGVGDALCALFAEYEAGVTPEAVLVKDLDKVEMVLQAGEYERAAAVDDEAVAAEGGGGSGDGRCGGGAVTTGRPLDLSEFFDGVRGRLTTPLATAWAAEAEARRPPAGRE